MSDLIDRLIVDFHIKKYATDCDEYFQLQVRNEADFLLDIKSLSKLIFFEVNTKSH
jgi:hypothetical protein